MVQRAPHEGGIGTRVGEPFEVGSVSDPAAGHELRAGERAAELAHEFDLRSGTGAHAGEVEDDDRSDSGAGCQLGDGEWREGAERGVGGDRLTGAEVEGEYGTAPLDLRHQSFELSALVRDGRESLEPHDHPRRTVGQECARLIGGGDSRIHPHRDLRTVRRYSPSKLTLRYSAGDRIEVGEVEFAEPQAVVEGADDSERVAGGTGRKLRRKWRVTGAISAPCMYRAAPKYVQYWNYAHRRAAVFGYGRFVRVAA